MGALAATLAFLTPLAFAGDESGRMARLAASTFPEIVIRKGETEHEWPFSLDQGELTCIGMGGQKYVFFREILTPEEEGTFGNMRLGRMVVVTANPLAYLATIEDSELYLPFDGLETLIKRLAPFEKMGWELCRQDETTPQSGNL